MTLPESGTAPIEPVRLTMDAAIDRHLEYIRKHRSLRTYRTYCPVLHVHFRNSYTKTYVDEVERGDILKFMSDMFDDGASAWGCPLG
jgi:integrase/recombinase XerD